MVKKHIRINAGVMAGMLLMILSACTQKEEVYIEEIYQRAYVSAEFYPYSECTYRQDDKRNSYTGRVSSTISGKRECEIIFQTIYPVKNELVGTLTVCDNAQEYVNEYNTRNLLSGNDAYKLLPENYYSIITDKSDIKIDYKKGETPYEVEIVEDISPLEGYYLLPLTCKLSSDDIGLSESMGVFIYKVIHILPADN